MFSNDDILDFKLSSFDIFMSIETTFCFQKTQSIFENILKDILVENMNWSDTRKTILWRISRWNLVELTKNPFKFNFIIHSYYRCSSNILRKYCLENIENEKMYTQSWIREILYSISSEIVKIKNSILLKMYKFNDKTSPWNVYINSSYFQLWRLGD